jgi:hypothetical protein
MEPHVARPAGILTFGGGAMLVKLTLLTAWLAVAPVVGAVRQPPAGGAPQLYRLLEIKESKFQEELDRNAAEGYRLIAGVAGVEIAIFERAGDDKRRSYLFTPDVEKLLKERKLPAGYRLVVPTFSGLRYRFSAVFEKVDGQGHAAEYGFITAGSSGGLRNRLEKGGNAASGVVAVALGEAGVAAVYEQTAQGPPGRIIASGNTGTLQREIQSAADHGQCLVDNDGIKEALYLFAACAGGGRSYEVIATTKTETFEKELNAAAARGFRLVPESLVGIEKRALMMAAYNNEAVGLVEKTAEATPVTYRVIGAVRLGTFRSEIEEAAAGGFRLVAFALGPKEALAVLAR